AGVAGGLLAMSNETANYNIFSTTVSAQVVLHTFVGGSTVFFGPIIGASVLTLFTFVASGATEAWMLYQGILFVLVMLFAPRGIGGVVHDHVVQRHELPWRRLAGPYAAAGAGGTLVTLAAVFVIQSLETVLSRDYAAALRRTGEYEAYAQFGLEWDPLSPVTWVFPLLLFVPGVYVLRRAFARISRLWSAEPDDDPGAEAAGGGLAKEERT
ncbi:branched-chain amino acid ABC transporter permease, partial [Ectothiorhodospiraceae bacterium WFHF3C12]|nr:branched-chain amino acid ABC transporter permease [Ectothiorhodospiraceae bacterium WFHF3C12]